MDIWWPLCIAFFEKCMTAENAITRQWAQWRSSWGFSRTRTDAHIMDNFSAYLFGLLATMVIEWALFHSCPCSIWWLIIAHLRQTKKREEIKAKKYIHPTHQHQKLNFDQKAYKHSITARRRGEETHREKNMLGFSALIACNDSRWTHAIEWKNIYLYIWIVIFHALFGRFTR